MLDKLSYILKIKNIHNILQSHYSISVFSVSASMHHKQNQTRTIQRKHNGKATVSHKAERSKRYKYIISITQVKNITQQVAELKCAGCNSRQKITDGISINTLWAHKRRRERAQARSADDLRKHVGCKWITVTLKYCYYFGVKLL